MNLDVSFKNKSISGYNDIYFSMVENSDSLQIDLFDNMIIDSIIYNGAKLKYLRDYNAVFVSFPKK
ncbi:MAG: hypothetical protein R2777_01635 [Chitinophagales bacterium]